LHVLIEHSFVTTLEEGPAMERAAAFLQRVGLRQQEVAGRRKGKRHKAYRGLPADMVPKKVQVGFDRGRINAAIAIEPKRKPTQVHRELLWALVTGLEQTIAAGQNEEVAAQQWSAVLVRERRRIRRNNIICTAVLLAMLGGFVALIWLASTM
jgi:hypothetical protein